MGSNNDPPVDREQQQSETADATRASSNTTTTQAQSDTDTGGGGAGEAAGKAIDSARQRLSEPAAKNQMKYIIGIFSLVGIGFGITGFLVLQLVAGGGGTSSQIFAAIFALSLLGVVLLLGPVIAVYSSLNTANGFYHDARTAYLASFVSNFAGYLIMVVVAVILIGAALGGGGSADSGATTGQTTSTGDTFDLGSLAIPMVALAIPVGLVGVGSTYLHRKQNTPNIERQMATS